MKTIEAAKGDNEKMMEAKVPHRETNEENMESHENYQEQLDQEATDVKEETLEENEITRDKTFPQIYIRKVMKSSKRKNGEAKKLRRVYNSLHACLYCKKLVQHIPTHIKRHRNEEEVRKTLEKYPLNSDVGKERARKIKCYLSSMLALRVKGNHVHNSKL